MRGPGRHDEAAPARRVEGALGRRVGGAQGQHGSASRASWPGRGRAEGQGADLRMGARRRRPSHAEGPGAADLRGRHGLGAGAPSAGVQQAREQSVAVGIGVWCPDPVVAVVGVARGGV